MLHLLFVFESMISERQSIPLQIEPPETSSQSSLSSTARFVETAKTFGIFNAAKRIYPSNIYAIDQISV